jgi:hypothetical protein
MTKSIVPRPSKLRRLIRCPGEPPALGPAAVAAVPAKIVTASSEGAQRQRDRAVDWPPALLARRRPLALGRLARRPPDEQRRGQQDQHREREVAHHPAVVELALDREAAEHRLGDDAERQQRAEPHQIAPVGAAPQRPQPGRAREQHDRDADHAV